MISAEDFILELNDSEESKNFKLANVVDLFINKTAKIKFDGEDTPSEKQYAYLESYSPKIFDRVLLGVLGGTYVILGKVNYNVAPPTEEELDRYLFDQKLVTIQKGLSVTGATTLNSGATIVGNVGVNGNISATGLSATGAVTGANLNVAGQVKGASLDVTGEVKGASLDVTGQVKGDTLNIAKAVSLAGLTVTGNIVSNGYTQIKGTAYADGAFIHRGSYLSFFNKNTNVNRMTVYTHGSPPDLNNLKTKLNELISALQGYGLIGGS